VIGALFHRRRWLAYGAGVGLVVSLAYAAVVGATLRTVDYRAFARPTFYAHGRELPRRLSFSDQLLTAGESYAESYESALAGLANLVVFASQGGGVAEPPTTTIVLASDLHANALVLPVRRGRRRPDARRSPEGRRLQRWDARRRGRRHRDCRLRRSTRGRDGTRRRTSARADAGAAFTDNGEARTVDLIEVEPLSGNAQARRIAVEPADDA
jgi:hypothetical protein